MRPWKHRNHCVVHGRILSVPPSRQPLFRCDIQEYVLCNKRSRISFHPFYLGAGPPTSKHFLQTLETSLRATCQRPQRGGRTTIFPRTFDHCAFALDTPDPENPKTKHCSPSTTKATFHTPCTTGNPSHTHVYQCRKL